MEDHLIGSRVLIEYGDHNDRFAECLPTEGRLVRRCVASSGADDWYLVELDRPIRYAIANQSEPTCFPRVLIRSRWADTRLGFLTAPSVFLFLVNQDQTVPLDPIVIDHYHHVCWAVCHITR